MEFHHAGIATNDAASLAALYGDLFGLETVHEETFDGIQVAFLDLGNGYLELLEPEDPTSEGAIKRYLDRNEPGIHHLAFATDDIEGALETARSHDVRLIDEEPRPGAWEHEVAFLHPKDTGGILLEFVAEH